ncbi:unnamed protein product [Linum trigynum]|uniref:RNase H type-1 domain-containing protein n=1 Tax=Linum trigynum TaxID=586398 RepID=A0AAV2GQR1_9ROSI
MQATFLPVSVCEAIDRKIRSFVWGSQEGKKKVHLVSWETLCKPKSQGGLGLRFARNLNTAYMIKLGWKLLNNESDLWVQVLQGKYFKSKDGMITSMKTSNPSNLWRAIRKAMPLMQSAASWSVRDGTTTSFWRHPWIDYGVILEDSLLKDIPETDRASDVASWVTNEGEWDWTRLNGLLPPCLLALIAGMETPKHELGEDKMIWGIERDGRFRLSSAYKLASDQLDSTMDPLWEKLWKWKGSARAKHFLCLAFHDRLLTNKERKNRKLTDNGNCSHCPDQEESVEHILRGCKKVERTWVNFRPYLTESRFDTPFHPWLINNLCDDKRGVEFGLICWQIWKQRNEECMDGASFSEAKLACKIEAWFFIFHQAQLNANKCFNPPEEQRVEIDLAWKPPPEGWVQIQADGSVLSPSGGAAAGGLIRDSMGRCRAAYVCNLGHCSITAAELKGAAEGLRLAWDRGFRKVELKIDSTTAIAVMKNCKDDSHRHGLLAQQVRVLLDRNWRVRISHVYRECNFAADYLASKGHSVDFGTHMFDVSDPGLTKWINYDVMGVAQPRFICNDS